MTLEQDLTKHFLYLERLKPKSVEVIQDNLEIAKENILNAMSNTNNQRQLRALIKKEVANAFSDLDELILDDVENVTGLAWNSTGAILTSYLSKDLAKRFIRFDEVDDTIRKNLLSPNQLVLGNNLEDYKNNFIYSANNKLRATVLQGLENKVGIDEVSRNMDAILGNIGRNQIRTVARTAMLSAINEAKSVQYEQMLDGLDVTYYYHSVMDSRTSKRCWTLNGFKSTNIKDVTRLLNYHYNCRSMLMATTPEIEAYEKNNPTTAKITQWESKTVHHRDGTNSSKFSIDSVKTVKRTASNKAYFDAFDEEYKIKYVGKQRYADYKANKISFDSMMGVTRNDLISKEALANSLGI